MTCFQNYIKNTTSWCYSLRFLSNSLVHFSFSFFRSTTQKIAFLWITAEMHLILEQVSVLITCLDSSALWPFGTCYTRPPQYWNHVWFELFVIMYMFVKMSWCKENAEKDRTYFSNITRLIIHFGSLMKHL